ncbi:MAG: DNA-binding protein, partial [Cyanobacteria bacterium J06555_12]
MRELRSIMSGSEPITAKSAKVLSDFVGGSAQFWINRQEIYESALERAVDAVAPQELDLWLTIPTPGPSPRGRLNEERRREELRRRLAFFGVGTLGAFKGRYSQQNEQTRFRKSTKLMSDDGATSLWLRQGEIEATLAETEAWNSNALEARIGEIKRLSSVSKPKRF